MPGEATGWYWLSVRPYDPALKRFREPDPSGFDGVRSCIYAGDDPHVGDQVLAEDPKTGKVEAKPVEAVIKDPVSPLLAIDLSDSSTITVTADHPFWVDRGNNLARAGWLPAGQLLPGNQLRTSNARHATVAALRFNVGHAAVYTLTVANDHTFWGETGPTSDDHDFFVGTARVLVHNSGPCPEFVGDIKNSRSMR
jgi:hypothetical protein